MRLFIAALLLASCEVTNPAYDNGDAVTPLPPGGDTDGNSEGGSPGSLDGPVAETSAPLDAAPETIDADTKAPVDATPDTTIMLSPDAATLVDSIIISPDAGVVVPPGLILHLPLTQTSGTTIADFSGYGNAARVICVQPCGNGFPLWLLRDSRRGIEMAYFHVLEIGPSPSLDSAVGDFSLFVWVNRIAQAGVRPIASRLTDGTNGHALHFFLNNGYLTAEVGLATVADPSPTPAQRWVHLGIRRSAGVVTLFRDSVAVASAPFDAMPPTKSPLLIGTSRQGTDNVSYADAILNSFVMYNRGLADSEVTALFNGTVPR